MLLVLFLVSVAAAGTLWVVWGRALFGNRVREQAFVPPPAHESLRIPVLPRVPAFPQAPSRLARGTTPQPILDTTPSVIVEPLAMRVPPPRAPSASGNQIPRSN